MSDDDTRGRVDIIKMLSLLLAVGSLTATATVIISQKADRDFVIKLQMDMLQQQSNMKDLMDLNDEMKRRVRDQVVQRMVPPVEPPAPLAPVAPAAGGRGAAGKRGH